ncbi:MAG: hypothetical protein ACLGIG_04095 [Actinomycetes bacterium]
MRRALLAVVVPVLAVTGLPAAADDEFEILAVEGGSRNPGFVPLLIVLLLLVATVLLIRNMSGRIRRLPRSFPDDEQQDGGQQNSERRGPPQGDQARGDQQPPTV